MTADRLKLVQLQSQRVNQLHAWLTRYYAMMVNLFSGLDSQMARCFLRAYPDPDQAATASEQHLQEFFKGAGYRVPSRIPDLIQKLKAPAPRAESVTARCAKLQMLSLLDQLEVLSRTLCQYDQLIQQVFDTHSPHDLFSSLPAGKETLGASLCGQLGEAMNRFQSSQVAQAFAGTAPVTQRSGKSQHVPIRYACDKVLRNVLQQFAFCSLRLSKWAREVYDAARKRGMKHQAALPVVAHKWVKIIFAMVRDHTLYDEQRFMTARS